MESNNNELITPKERSESSTKKFCFSEFTGRTGCAPLFPRDCILKVAFYNDLRNGLIKEGEFNIDTILSDIWAKLEYIKERNYRLKCGALPNKTLASESQELTTDK